MLGAEVADQVAATGAQLGLEAAGPVVDPGVHDAGVVAGLVGREAVLLLEDHHRVPGRRRVSSRAMARPTMPPPTIPTGSSLMNSSPSVSAARGRSFHGATGVTLPSSALSEEETGAEGYRLIREVIARRDAQREATTTE